MRYVIVGMFLFLCGCQEFGPNTTGILRECVQRCDNSPDCIRACGEMIRQDCKENDGKAK